MFGKIPVSTLILDDAEISFAEAVLSVDSNAFWRLEIDTVESNELSTTIRETSGSYREAAITTQEGFEIRGTVRLSQRRLFPYRKAPVVLEGIRPLQAGDLNSLL